MTDSSGDKDSDKDQSSDKLSKLEAELSKSDGGMDLRYFKRVLKTLGNPTHMPEQEELWALDLSTRKVEELVASHLRGIQLAESMLRHFDVEMQTEPFSSKVLLTFLSYFMQAFMLSTKDHDVLYLASDMLRSTASECLMVAKMEQITRMLGAPITRPEFEFQAKRRSS